jgi:hypothetical protein
MTTSYRLTAKQVREIAAQSGLAHAEFCIEQAESQIGTDRLKEARDELNRLIRDDETAL